MTAAPKYAVATKVRKATRADIFYQKDIMILAAQVKALKAAWAKHATQ